MGYNSNECDTVNERTKKTILLVEDEVVIAATEVLMLEKHGYEVLTAVSGEEAVDIANKNDAIDLILMDIDLGEGMDGTEAAERILKIKEIPIVFLSAHTEPEIVAKTERITSYGYVVKSSGPTVLLASLKMAFRLFEAHKKIHNQRAELEHVVQELKVTNTELARSREELLDREMKMSYFYPAIMAVANGIVITDRRGMIIWVNPAFSKMTGYTVEEAIGKNPGDLVKSGMQDVEFYNGMWETILSGNVWEGILINRRKNGTQYTEEMTITPVKDKAGNITHFIAVKQDVSARISAEKKLLVVHQRLNAIFENSSDGIVTLSEKNIVTMCNRAASEILGYPKEKLIEKSILLIYKSKEYFQEVGKRVYPELKEKGHYRGEVEIIRGDGEARFCEIALSRIIANEDSDGLICVFRDITQKRQEQQRLLLFREMIDTAPGSITIHDRTGRFLYANRRTFEMHGMSEKEFMGKNLKEIDIPASAAVIEERMRLIEQNSEAHFEVEHFKGDGSHFPLEVYAKKVEWEGMPAVLSIATDITQRKAGEEAFRSAAEEKQSLLRELQHRIKNTMSMIASLINLEKEFATNQYVATSLNNLHGRINSLAELYALLYTYGEVRQVSLGNYLQSVSESIMKSYYSDTYHICFEYHFDDIVIDTKKASLLGLILNELLVNALKYAFGDRSTGVIKVLLHHEDETLSLEVADNGVGVPEGFDLSHSGGFGIRLIMMLTKQMSGRFVFEDTPMTIFRVTIPLA